MKKMLLIISCLATFAQAETVPFEKKNILVQKVCLDGKTWYVIDSAYGKVMEAKLIYTNSLNPSDPTHISQESCK